MVIDCINTDFSTFLDQNEYGHYLDDCKSATHETYGKIFLHHDPRQQDDYNYFTRCVQRFRKVCNSKTLNILFLLVFYNKNGVEVDNIILHAKKLLPILTTHVKSKFTLLIIIHTTDEMKEKCYADEHFMCKVIYIGETLRDLKFVQAKSNKVFLDYLRDNFKFDLVSKDFIEQ